MLSKWAGLHEPVSKHSKKARHEFGMAQNNFVLAPPDTWPRVMLGSLPRSDERHVTTRLRGGRWSTTNAPQKHSPIRKSGPSRTTHHESIYISNLQDHNPSHRLTSQPSRLLHYAASPPSHPPPLLLARVVACHRPRSPSPSGAASSPWPTARFARRSSTMLALTLGRRRLALAHRCRSVRVPPSAISRAHLPTRPARCYFERCHSCVSG